jgi:hypothetical protein
MSIVSSYSRAGIGRIGSPLAGGIFSGITHKGGQPAALVMAPKEFGEYTATLRLNETGIIEAVPPTPAIVPTPPKTHHVEWDAPWTIPSRDELEHLFAIWGYRKAPIDIAWYENDRAAWSRFSSRTTEFSPTWYWSDTPDNATTTNAWALYAHPNDGDTELKPLHEVAIIRLVRRIVIA